MVHAASPPPATRPAAATLQSFGGDHSFAVDPAAVGLVRNGGNALPGPLLAKMEAVFGADFSGVRIHVGPQASRIGALAFTTGNDLYFAPGQYQPDTVKGQQLIGHELAHVLQQRQGRVRAPGSGVAVVQDRALEAEADRLGMMASASITPLQRKTPFTAILRSHARLALQRSKRKRGADPESEKDNSEDEGGEEEEENVKKKQRKSGRARLGGASVKNEMFKELKKRWNGAKTAGKRSNAVKITSSGKHACGAQAVTNAKDPFVGNFHSDRLHAEMEAIEKVWAEEGTLRNIKHIHIEKEPCTRCAVVLNALNLSGKVKYKDTGQKDYPTWRFPDLGSKDQLEMINVRVTDTTNHLREEIISEFRSQKWW